MSTHDTIMLRDLRPPLDLLDPESLWTFDSYGPTIRIPEYAGSIT
ncbi:predicted protein [Sclerotinia sclerotiorum 1980 UF-70]|uniref:Uncharacterized protein n=1 Tax=Sclerotinia sclerotiorum (strain ATCC 18683 / 1980 / Ss-1) TaxID=665079 RepID=A7EV87_SCLS1|nr:predicted protein [Sclerotinia sclerotiorum 1980 UF-70]EDN93379.1 predicted protein [Sclerotinia sclerotiorum 1980 UF-70]